MKYAVFILALMLTACVSTKSTIRNIDDTAPEPVLKGQAFVLTEKSTDSRYGFDPDYPANVFYKSVQNDTINATRYLHALAGPNGEKITFRKVDTCCPFPAGRSETGAGVVDIYEVTWTGQKKALKLYVNTYAKGKVLIPMGFTAAK